MPYLNNAIRASLKDGRLPMTGGELNYVISVLIDDFISRRGLSYSVINEALGAMEASKLEFYRRTVAPYEDKKCRENGEVFNNARS